MKIVVQDEDCTIQLFDLESGTMLTYILRIVTKVVY